MLESRDAAEAGARQLHVQYSEARPVLVTTKDAIAAKSFHGRGPQQFTAGDDYDAAIAKAPKTIKGNLEIGSQAHYYMETQVSHRKNKLSYFSKNAHPEISAHQKQWFFKGGSTQNRWLLMGDFSKGGEYTKPMALGGWFFKGGST